MSAPFAFKRHAPTHGDLHHATASLPGDWAFLLAVSAKSEKVILSRHAAGLYVSLDLTPEQARALGAELIAAADAPQATPAPTKREA